MADDDIDLPLPQEPVQESVPAPPVGQWSQPPPPGQHPQGGSSFVDHLIPTKNVPALISYYLGVFSIIPCLAILLGTGAVITGVMGLNNIKKDPRLPGKTHAWVGIIAGGIFLLLNLFGLAVVLLGVMQSKRS